MSPSTAPAEDINTSGGLACAARATRSVVVDSERSRQALGGGT